MKRLSKSRTRMASVEAYACVCLSATCSCGCGLCNCSCERWVNPEQDDYADAQYRIYRNFYVSNEHRHGLTDNMRL